MLRKPSCAFSGLFLTVPLYAMAGAPKISLLEVFPFRLPHMWFHFHLAVANSVKWFAKIYPCCWLILQVCLPAVNAVDSSCRSCLPAVNAVGLLLRSEQSLK